MPILLTLPALEVTISSMEEAAVAELAEKATRSSTSQARCRYHWPLIIIACKIHLPNSSRIRLASWVRASKGISNRCSKILTSKTQSVDSLYRNKLLLASIALTTVSCGVATLTSSKIGKTWSLHSLASKMVSLLCRNTYNRNRCSLNNSLVITRPRQTLYQWKVVGHTTFLSL